MMITATLWKSALVFYLAIQLLQDHGRTAASPIDLNGPDSAQRGDNNITRGSTNFNASGPGSDQGGDNNITGVSTNLNASGPGSDQGGQNNFTRGSTNPDSFDATESTTVIWSEVSFYLNKSDGEFYNPKDTAHQTWDSGSQPNTGLDTIYSQRPGRPIAVDTDDNEEEESSSSGQFFGYLLTATVLCISGYVIYHNKQKIKAFCIEGRNGPNGRRRSGSRGVKYTQLKSNKEEVMPSLEKSTTAKNYVY